MAWTRFGDLGVSHRWGSSFGRDRTTPSTVVLLAREDRVDAIHGDPDGAECHVLVLSCRRSMSRRWGAIELVVRLPGR
jgi:hypothetical protein